jgi:triphosphoribosyl-dephospho-CoA synthetase
VERPSKEDQTTVPPFEITPVSPGDPAWDQLWPDDDSDPAKQKAHAYAWLPINGVTNVFYSEVFPAFAETLAKLKSTKTDLVEAYTTNYEVWVAYHAILQKKADEETVVDAKNEATKELLLDQQRAIVATMQAKQSVQFAEMWKKGLVDRDR